MTTLGSGQAVGDVDESFGAAALLDDRKNGRIAKVPVNLPTVVPVLVIGAAIVFGGFELMDSMNPPPPTTKEPSFEDRYTALVRQTFAAKMPRANELAPAILASLGNSETVIAGWVFDKAACPSKGNCTITYKRYGGSFDDFSRAAPQALRPLHFEADGLHLSARGPAIPAVTAVSSSDARTWPSEQGLIALLQTPPQRLSTKPFELASYGYKVNLEPAKLLLAMPPGTPGKRPAHMISVGSWEISGYRWQSVLLSKLPSDMTLDSMTIELMLDERGASRNQSNPASEQVGIHFIAKGKYYVLD